MLHFDLLNVKSVVDDEEKLSRNMYELKPKFK